MTARTTIGEAHAYIVQRARYFGSELHYSDELLDLMANSANGNPPSGKETGFLASGREHLWALQSGLNRIHETLHTAITPLLTDPDDPELPSKIDRPLYRCEEILRWLASGLHHLQIFIQQFKKRPIRNYSYASLPAVPLGELHGAYSQEMEIMSRLNQIAHWHLGKLMFDAETDQKSRMKPALICISDQRDYSFDTSCNGDTSLNHVLPFHIGDDYWKDEVQFRDFLRLRLAARYVNIPRFSLGELKYSPLLLHEIVHSIYQIPARDMLNVIGGCTATTGIKPEGFPDHIDRGLIEFGGALKEIHRWFADSEDIEAQGEGGWKKVYPDEESYLTCRYRIANLVEEAVADYLSLLISGPAYFYSLLVTVLHEMTEPMYLRLAFLARELSDLGYPGDFMGTLRNLAPESEEEWSSSTQYKELVEVNRFALLREFFLERIGTLPVDPRLYEPACRDIAETVGAGDYMLKSQSLEGRNTSLLYILNAIWYKRFFLEREERPYHVWRLAMQFAG